MEQLVQEGLGEGREDIGVCGGGVGQLVFFQEGAVAGVIPGGGWRAWDAPRFLFRSA